MAISDLHKQAADPFAVAAEIKSSHEYRAVNDYVQGKTHDASHARDKFCEPVEDEFMRKPESEEVQGLLWRAWTSITSIAPQLAYGSEQQQRLVDFVLGVASRPKLQKGETTGKVWDLTVWSDLPVFGAQMRESWNFDVSAATSEQVKTQWLNLNAFAALLTQKAAQRKVKGADFSLYAIWSLRAGLEESEHPEEVSVEAAALWLRYAASTIYELSQQEKSFEGKLAAPGALFKEKEWRGFSKERWRTWSSRLSGLQDQKLEKRCEQHVTEARKVMGEHLER